MTNHPTPPVPSKGLPDGWSMEQWEEYGWEYYDSLAIQSQIYPKSTRLPSLPENFWTYFLTVLIVIATPLFFREVFWRLGFFSFFIQIGLVILGTKFMLNDSNDKSKTILGVALLTSSLFSYSLQSLIFLF